MNLLIIILKIFNNHVGRIGGVKTLISSKRTESFTKKLIIMSQYTTWLYPNQVYVLSGGACANSLFFEDKYCHQLFFKYLTRFVEPMVHILQYKLHATEWVLLIQTKSDKEIRKAYKYQRNKSKKADRSKDLVEVERMLSEHFRLFLSNFATCLL